MGSKPMRWLKRPAWSRPFIEEPAEKAIERVSVFSRYTIFSCWIALIGLGLQTTSAVFCTRFIPAAALWGVLLVYLLSIQPRTVNLIADVLIVAICICQVALLIAERKEQSVSLPHVWAVAALLPSAIMVGLALNMPFRDPRISKDGISKAYSTPTEEERSPEDNLTLWQWMTVSWVGPLITIGNKRQIQPEDVWRLPYVFQHRQLHNAFAQLQGSVLRRLLRANWIDLAIMTCLSLTELTGKFTSPLILQQLLRSMENVHETKAPALFLAGLTLLVRYVIAQSAVITLWYSRRAYERTRGELITMIYEKTLHRKIQGAVSEKTSTEDVPVTVEDVLTETEAAHADNSHIEAGETHALLDEIDQKPIPSSGWLAGCLDAFRKLRTFWSSEQKVNVKEPASMGKILNLMKGDAYSIAQRAWEFPDLINQPLGFIFSLSLTLKLIGWPCLFGVGVVVIVQILNALLVKLLVKWETIRRSATDAKLQKISQYIQAIRHLRFYAWHEKWLGNIQDARQRELNLTVVTRGLLTCIMFSNALAYFLLPTSVFWAYTSIKGERLSVDIAFPALQLFQLLQNNLEAIPRLISVVLDAAVAAGRIQDFMDEPNKVEDESGGQHFGDQMETKSASFSWPGTSSPVLKDISVTFPAGLSVIHGQVGAGKTALLQALLGELDLVQGELFRPSTAVAYCSQTPWLQSMTIRENILFNGLMDADRYKQVLHACALVPDLANFEHGDNTAIGENGIGLSGGQKMRVALARAMYSKARFLLLDDPLSALDQQTAEHVVRHCFRGQLMQDRTVVLVNHRLDLVGSCADLLIEIKAGVATSHAGKGQELPVEIVEEGKHDNKQGEEDLDNVMAEKFEEDEKRAEGGVRARIYWQYIKAGRLRWWLATLIPAAFCRTGIQLHDYFIKDWAEAYGNKAVSVFTMASPVSRLLDRYPDPAEDPRPWVLTLLSICVIICLLYGLCMIASIAVTYIAGKRLFKKVMAKISSTEFRYYDITPTGRLMNRLTADMGTIDGNIPDTLMSALWEGIAWLAAVVVIALVTPAFLIAVVILTLTFILIFLRFIAASQSLRRLEMVSLSPLMTNFGTLLEGLMTVRAFCAQSQFQDRNIFTTDAFQQMDHFYWSLQAWLMYRYDLLSAFSTLAITILAIYSNLSPGLVAFVLLAATSYVLTTHELCKKYGTIQLDFVSVERVIELLDLKSEDPGKVNPPASWPTAKDDVVFEDVTLSYAPHLEPALKQLSFTIPGGSSTAVIGRTGSGKSTMATALLGTIKPTSGRILIGGIDLAKVNKQALRSRITFLAQDPVLFPGSLRHNLDPNEEHSDDECSAVLERVCGSYGWTLDTEVDSGGKNFSQGQRQLIGLTRAILRRSTVVIMDEATASIDRKTSWEIQRVLKEELAGSTVITIAHRPSAVRGADMCLKLANGRLEAQGRPEEVVPDDSQPGSVLEDAI